MQTANQNITVNPPVEDQTGKNSEEPIFTDDVEIISSGGTEAEQLREQLASERDARLRLAAEYDNYRRRTKQESANAAEQGKRDLLEHILSLADDVDRAVGNLSDADGPTAEGVRMIHKKLHDMLESNGIVGFESIGAPFDPERHEAFDVFNGTNAKPGTVHSEVRRGYFWHGRLLRPALVVVAQ